MEEMLIRLAGMALRDQAVASQRTPDGEHLLVYPLEKKGEIIVAFGFENDLSHKVNSEGVLRRRSENMENFGRWLPTLFADGSWYLLQRVTNVDPDSTLPILTSDELKAAQELLS